MLSYHYQQLLNFVDLYSLNQNIRFISIFTIFALLMVFVMIFYSIQNMISTNFFLIFYISQLYTKQFFFLFYIQKMNFIKYKH